MTLTVFVARSVCETSVDECQSEAEEAHARKRAALSLQKRRAEEAVARVVYQEMSEELIQEVAAEQCRWGTTNKLVIYWMVNLSVIYFATYYLGGLIVITYHFKRYVN